MFCFSIYWEESSQLTFIFFQRGRYTTNQYCYPDFDELRPHHVCCLKATTPGIQLVLWGATGRLGDVGYKQCIGLMKFNGVQ